MVLKEERLLPLLVCTFLTLNHSQVSPTEFTSPFRSNKYFTTRDDWWSLTEARVYIDAAAPGLRRRGLNVQEKEQ